MMVSHLSSNWPWFHLLILWWKCIFYLPNFFCYFVQRNFNLHAITNDRLTKLKLTLLKNAILKWFYKIIFSQKRLSNFIGRVPTEKNYISSKIIFTASSQGRIMNFFLKFFHLSYISSAWNRFGLMS